MHLQIEPSGGFGHRVADELFWQVLLAEALATVSTRTVIRRRRETVRASLDGSHRLFKYIEVESASLWNLVYRRETTLESMAGFLPKLTKASLVDKAVRLLSRVVQSDPEGIIRMKGVICFSAIATVVSASQASSV